MPLTHKGLQIYAQGIIDEGKVTLLHGPCAGEIDGLIEGAFGVQGHYLCWGVDEVHVKDCSL